jgi:class 3 adenylate cyclase
VAVTENITVLFTDLVGSTELYSGLSPAGADQLRRAHFSALRQAIASSGGTEVKNLGDGLMVVFPTASAALSCAVGMQQVVDRDNHKAELSLGLRVGLSAGEVTTEDEDYFGDPVVEAARLCAQASGGEILASDVVRVLAGRRSPHRYRRLGPVELRGLPDPVEAVGVGWDALAGPGTVPIPRRLEARPGEGVVGREVELEKVTDAYKRVASAEVREILLVSGEAGLGKTTLVAQAARAASDEGACVLFGHSEENLATPYQLFAEAIGHFLTHADEELVLAHLDVHGSELNRLAPVLASRIPDLPPSKATDAETERFLFFTAVVGLLEMVSVHQPVVLVLDDLQWADQGSLLLLRHLAAAGDSMRVLILGTFRDTELSRSHPLLDTLAALHREGSVTRIELTGLDGAGVVSFLEAAAGHELDDAGIGLAHAVHRETDGNPFFVSEVLRHLSETGAIYQDAEGRWTTADSVDRVALPDSVREVIGARIGRLGESAEHVLSLAAVIGRDFEFDVLAQASGTTEDELLDILDAAASVALVRELADRPGRYLFAHALIQHTLYEDMGATRRARAHRQVAEALEDLYGDRPGAPVAELARHWFNATQPIDLAKALGYSRQAADAALDALAPADALGHYAQAFELYALVDEPDPVLALDLAIGLGTAQRQTGDPTYRTTLLDASRQAAAIGDTERLVWAALANTRGYYSAAGQIDDERVAVLEDTLERLGDGNPRLRARLKATLCSEMTFHPSMAERRVLAGRAKDEAMEIGDPATLVHVYAMVIEALRHPTLLAERLEDTAAALALAEELGDPAAYFWAVSHRMRTAMEAGYVVEARRLSVQMDAAADRVGQPVMRWMSLYSGAQWSFLAGHTAAGEELAEKALALGIEIGQPDAFPYYATQLSHARWQQGRLAEIVDLIEAGARDNVGIPAYGGALARALCQAGRLEEARELLDKAASNRFADLPADLLWAYGMVTFAEAAIRTGHHEAAESLYEQLAPFENQLCFLGTTCEGPIAWYLAGLAGVLGLDEVDGHLGAAAKLDEATGSPYFAARTAIQRGRAAARRREDEVARRYLSEGRGLAATWGFADEVRTAAAALSDLG